MSSKSGTGGDAKNTLYCSFCGKSQHEVRKLIAGPTVFICDECGNLIIGLVKSLKSQNRQLKRQIKELNRDLQTKPKSEEPKLKKVIKKIR